MGSVANGIVVVGLFIIFGLGGALLYTIGKYIVNYLKGK